MPGFGREPVVRRKSLYAMQVVNADVLGIYSGIRFSSRNRSIFSVALLVRCYRSGGGGYLWKEGKQLPVR